MSYNGAAYILKMAGWATEGAMAQWELHKRFGLKQSLWWKFMPGVEVELPWPTGWVVLHENPDGSRVSTESADPNDHYRPWLEKNIGKQGWDWEWKHIMTDTMISPGYEDQAKLKDRVVVKIRNKHKEAAIMLKLKYT
jgi:hypothetical protein